MPNAILGGAGLLMLAGLINGLTLDFGNDGANSVGVRYRIKIIALSGIPNFFGAAVGGAVVVGLAVLLALALARGASPSVLRTVGNGAAAIAGLMALLTLAAVVIDLTLLAEDIDSGAVAAALLADLASLVLLGAGVLGGINTAREA